MTGDDRAAIAAALCMAYPPMAADRDRVAFVLSQVERYTRAAAERGLREYLTVAEKFFNPNRYVAVVYRCYREDLERQVDAERARQADQKIRAQAELERWHQYVEQVIGGLGDDDLRAWHELVLDEVPPALRDFYRAKDPRKFRSLKELIVQRMQTARAA